MDLRGLVTRAGGILTVMLDPLDLLFCPILFPVGIVLGGITGVLFVSLGCLAVVAWRINFINWAVNVIFTKALIPPVRNWVKETFGIGTGVESDTTMDLIDLQDSGSPDASVIASALEKDQIIDELRRENERLKSDFAKFKIKTQNQIQQLEFEKQELTAELQLKISQLALEARVNELEAHECKEPAEQSESATPECFGISVIMKKIFQLIPNQQLLELSSVNKLWNEEARLVMRKRANVVARLECHDQRQCEHVFQTFGAHLRRMNVVPFSGLAVQMNTNSVAASCVSAAILDSTYEAILARLPLKQFSITLPGHNWLNYDDGITLLILKQTMEDFGGVLEQLTLDIKNNLDKFVRDFIPTCAFPRLKILTLKDRSLPERTFTDRIKMLVQRAPNLQELHTDGSVSLMENVLEGTSAIHMREKFVSRPMETISESVISALRLKRLELTYERANFDWAKFDRLAPILLETCCSRTLEELQIDAIMALPFMNSAIPLLNVNELSIEIHYDVLEAVQPRIINIMKQLDFTRLLPSLNIVELYKFDFFDFDQDHMDTIIEQGEAALRDPRQPDRALNIKNLKLNRVSHSPSAFQFYSEMFPSIKQLQMEAGDIRIPFVLIWEHWPDLERIEVEGQLVESTSNLDSAFCGIFPEEVEELGRRNKKYLKKVHIVPIMPAITSFKRLQTLILTHFRSERGAEPYVNDGTFMFSKVTGFVGLAKHRALAINLNFRADDGINLENTSHLRDLPSVHVHGLA